MASFISNLLTILQKREQLGTEEFSLPAEIAHQMASTFPVPVLVLSKPHNRIIWASPGTMLLLGISAKDLKKLSPTEFIQQFFETPEPLLEAYKGWVMQKEFTLRLRAKDLMHYVMGVFMAMSPEVGLLIFQDVSEIESLRQEMAQYAEELRQQNDMLQKFSSEKEELLARLKEQTEKLRLVATATSYSNMMKFILDPEGKIVWVNKMFEQASGWKAEELIGKNVREIGGSFAHLLRNPDMKPSEGTLITNHFERAPFTEEIYAYDREGRGFWMMLTLAPVTDESGKTTHYLGALLNITQRKERELRLREYQSEIERSLQYASRMQQKVLGSIQVVRRFFANAELWYQPQQKVSGDFYVFEEVGERLMIAVGDSAGHNISASLASLYTVAYLRTLVGKLGGDLKQLYQALIEEVRETFQNEEEKWMEKFDLSLLLYDPAKKEINYLGMRRPLWVMRGAEMYSLVSRRGEEGETFAEGAPLEELEPQRIPLKTGDRLYIFSDGVTCQLNKEGNRYSSSRLKEFLLSYATLSLKEQIEMLQQNLRHWAMGQPQTDDILLIAMQV
ncbi:MAG: SpoIIE family protein phosphatase [Bacteroidia bacterium]|nr:SpoIIE family protein phosphatase [Bacteroidia bacterium]MDW8236404.1 SpoIIE family protein phosphatase [Bacteroidia bacterium]